MFDNITSDYTLKLWQFPTNVQKSKPVQRSKNQKRSGLILTENYPPEFLPTLSTPHTKTFKPPVSSLHYSLRLSSTTPRQRTLSYTDIYCQSKKDTTTLFTSNKISRKLSENALCHSRLRHLEVISEEGVDVKGKIKARARSQGDMRVAGQDESLDDFRRTVFKGRLSDT